MTFEDKYVEEFGNTNKNIAKVEIELLEEILAEQKLTTAELKKLNAKP